MWQNVLSKLISVWKNAENFASYLDGFLTKSFVKDKIFQIQRANYVANNPMTKLSVANDPCAIMTR